MRSRAVNLFSGAGGWETGAQDLGIEVLGIEVNKDAAATARAAGHTTVRADILGQNPADYRGWLNTPNRMISSTGLIASPPCQTFSLAGNGAGRKALDEVLAAIDHFAIHRVLPDTADLDPRTRLVLEPLRWARVLMPDWIALEQVPPVLPIWEAYAEVLRSYGYTVVTGNLQAEQYGVAQTRKRAILMAHRTNPAIHLPTPTHSRYYGRDPQQLDPGVLPWVPMAEALGWGEQGLLRSNYTHGGDLSTRGERDLAEPSFTVTGKFGRNFWHFAGGPAVRLTVEEAAALQSFPADYPWQGKTKGSKYMQVGNAIPPLLARAVLGALTERITTP